MGTFNSERGVMQRQLPVPTPNRGVTPAPAAA